MSIFADLLLNAIDSALDGTIHALDHAQDVVDAVLGDPKEEGMKRGYEKAANEFEPLVAKIEQEYQEVACLISQTNQVYNQKIELLLNKIKVLEEEKCKLLRRRNNCAKQYGISSQVLCDFASNRLTGNNLIWGLYVNKRILCMKKAEQAAYIEACNKFKQKIEPMRKRLKDLKHAADENLKNRIDLVESCLAEIISLQQQIIAASILR